MESSKADFLKPLSKLWIHNFGFNYRLVDKCNCRSRESVVTVVWIINWSTTWVYVSNYPCCPRDSQESCAAPQFESISSLVLRLLHGPTLTSIHNYWKNHSFDYVDLQCCISFCCTAKWLLYIYILCHILIHYALSQDTEYSSLCYAVGPCCLSIIYIYIHTHIHILICIC